MTDHPSGERHDAVENTVNATTRDEAPVLPSRSRDDSDVGWGDELSDRSGERDEEWYRRERPPHHGD